MLVALLIFVVLSAVCKAVKDTLAFHYGNSIFSKLNPQYWDLSISWKNKYKEDLKTPKFWGSTTILVWLTDAWHLFDMLGVLCLFLAMIFAVCAYVTIVAIIFYIIAMFVVYFGVFEAFFRLFVKK